MGRRAMWLDEADDSDIRDVQALILDAEGCLTDGLKLVSEDGDIWLRYSAIDGLGVWLLARWGMKVAVVSASRERSIDIRAHAMGAHLCALGVTDKAACVAKLCKEWGVALEAVCVMGDDLWDVGAMQIAGVSVCPFGARPEVVERAMYRTRASGGQGAVRELTDRLLAAKGLSTDDLLGLLET